MPQFDGFDPKEKTTSVFDVDLLKLDKDQSARICLLDKGPVMEYSHYIRSYNTDGELKGGYYICLGDPTVMKGKARDADNCPACAFAEDTQDAPVGKARRRFVIPVFRYNTNDRGSILKPLGGKFQAWIFGDDKFNTLVDISQENGGDLRKNDLILNCASKQFQKMTIIPSPQWTIMTTESGKEQYQEVLKEKKAELERLLGRKVAYDVLEKLVSDATPAAGRDEVNQYAKAEVEELLNETATPGFQVQDLATLAGDDDAPATGSVEFGDLLED